MSTAFEKMMRGLDEVEAYMAGAREGYRVHVPVDVDVKEIRGRLGMTQAKFSEAFGFSLDAVKHWEGGRRQPEVAARAYLTVIAKEPEAVMRALGRGRVTRRRAKVADAQDIAVSRSRRREKGASLGQVKARLVAAGKVAA
jgi:putative transcriptional regulator